MNPMVFVFQIENRNPAAGRDGVQGSWIGPRGVYRARIGVAIPPRSWPRHRRDHAEHMTPVSPGELT
jgi:hypothetical protein